MSANNRRIRRILVDILWTHGAMTKEEMASILSKNKSIRTVPSPHSLAALLSKNPQIVSVGKQTVENVVGVKANHLIYDINRDLIRSLDDITYTRTPTVMTPNQAKQATRCNQCGRIRIKPKLSDVCLHCIRSNACDNE
tara:strand:- start:57 stop:473 length:417 start_codon:yes stop_codon:yes gene_type:complete